MSAVFPVVVTLTLTLAGCTSVIGSSSSSPRQSAKQSSPDSAASSSTPRAVTGTAIRITIGDHTTHGHLRDNATARSLLGHLPLTATFKDFNGVEMTRKLPAPFSMDDMPEGDDPQPNDIGYYAPTGDLVLYYGNVGYWDGIARIGTLDNSDIITSQTDTFTATVELAE